MKRIALKASMKTTSFSQNMGQKLGIVGGGQLARMLALSAAPLGLEVHILCEKSTEPAAQVARHWHQGSPQSATDVQEFTKNLQLLTFESEFYDMETFLDLEKKTNLQIFPNPTLMRTLQDRSSQKELLLKHKIPTAPFVHVQTADDLHKSFAHFPKGFVLKKCQGGYDGNGTFYCRNQSDLKKLESLLPGNFIAESFINFKHELAIVLVRSKDGSLIHLPLVESHQKLSRCDWVIGPIQHPKAKATIKKLSTFLEKIKYVGAIGFELFDAGNKTNTELVVNEIAPRVHNTGHYSQDALSESQFLLHLKAGLGLTLHTPIQKSKSFCMVNLIGQSQNFAKFPQQISGALHWYGKLENRPGRKMGHINYTSNTSPTVLLKKALLERKKFHL